MEIVMHQREAKPKFTFENTRHKLGLRIWGDRMSFLDLHEDLLHCWECEGDSMSHVESCSYIGIISYFTYEVRHAFMGDRLVKLDGTPVKIWTDEMFQLFEEEKERFTIGMELPWPHVLFIIASWWECFRQQDCPVDLLPLMREFTDNVEALFQERSKREYPRLTPYLHGAIYTGNPYLMHYMEHVTQKYFWWSRLETVRLGHLADLMECASFETYEYRELLGTLRREAKRNNCPIEELRIHDDSYGDVEL